MSAYAATTGKVAVPNSNLFQDAVLGSLGDEVANLTDDNDIKDVRNFFLRMFKTCLNGNGESGVLNMADRGKIPHWDGNRLFDRSRKTLDDRKLPASLLRYDSLNGPAWIEPAKGKYSIYQLIGAIRERKMDRVMTKIIQGADPIAFYAPSLLHYHSYRKYR